MRERTEHTDKDQLVYHRFKGEVPPWVEEAIRNGHTWWVWESDYIIHATTLAGAWEKVFRMEEFKVNTREPYVDEGGPTLLRQEAFTRITNEDVEHALAFLRTGEGVFVDGGPETEKPLTPEHFLTREELQARARKCKRGWIRVQIRAEEHYYHWEFSEYGLPYAEQKLEQHKCWGNTLIDEWHLLHAIPRQETIYPETMSVYGGVGDYLVCTPTPIEYHWTYERVRRETAEEIILEWTAEGEYFIAVPQVYFGYLSIYGFESPCDYEGEDFHVRVVERWRGDKAFQAFHRTTGTVREVCIPHHESHGWWFKLLETDDGKIGKEEWQQKVRDNHPS